ncbi:MAG: peptidase M17, partial [Flavobacteriia bacterium]|nr:peptidase M17 [Flavobacteriia bacterium]
MSLIQNTASSDAVKAFASSDIQSIIDYFGADSAAYINHASENSFSGWIQIPSDGRYHLARILKVKGENYEQTEAARRAGAGLAGWLNGHSEKDVQIEGEFAAAIAEGCALRNYKFTELFSDRDKKKNKLASIHLPSVSKSDFEEVSVRVEATCIARDLVNTPVLQLNAEKLAYTAKQLGEECGFHVEIFNKKKIESLKMGGLLGVNKGSIDPPTFSIMEYKPDNARNKKPIILVGKGVVYDTGGLSLKPSTAMDTMKSDMGGAAAVIGTMVAVSKAKLDVHVIGLVPATDNRPGLNAITPGDVITMYDGTTVEVMNTDAEGRLILADALHYAKKFNPKLVIDLATLTGAAARAIGSQGIVAMGTAEKKVFDHLSDSGKSVYERLAIFPFWKEYSDMLKSDIA